MTDRRLYVVNASVAAGDDSAVLLSLASVLHRRGVHPHSVELSRAVRGRRTFTAAFSATSRQAATLRASLDNLVHVCQVALEEAAGDTPAM